MTNEKLFRKFEGKVAKILLDRYDGTRQQYFIGQIVLATDAYLYILDLEDPLEPKDVLVSHNVVESVLFVPDVEEEVDEDDIEIQKVGVVKDPREHKIIRKLEKTEEE